MKYYIVEAGRVQRGFRVDIPNKALISLTNKNFTMAPVVEAIRTDKGNDLATLFLIHRYPTDIYSSIFEDIGDVIQCSKEFTMHDAYKTAADWVFGGIDGISFVDIGVSLNSEAFSVYRKDELIDRQFGLDKSLAVLCENMLANGGMLLPVDYSELSRDTRRAIQSRQEKDFESIFMKRDKRDVNKLYDTLAYQGAEVALRLHHLEIQNKMLKKTNLSVSNKAAISFYTSLFIYDFMLMIFRDTQPKRFIGEYFSHSWIQSILQQFYPDAEFISVHPGLGLFFKYMHESSNEK